MPNKIIITKNIPTNSSLRGSVNSYKAGTGYDMPQLSQTSSSIYIPTDILNKMGLNKSFANYSDEDYNNLYRANDFYAYYNDGLANNSYSIDDLNNAYQQYLAGKYSTQDEINKAAEFGGKYYTYEDAPANSGYTVPTVQTQPDGEVTARSPLRRRDILREARDKWGLKGRDFRQSYRMAKRSLSTGTTTRAGLSGNDLQQGIRSWLYDVSHPGPEFMQTPMAPHLYSSGNIQVNPYIPSYIANNPMVRGIAGDSQEDARKSILAQMTVNPNYFSVDISKYNHAPEDISVEETLPEGAPKPVITPRYKDGDDFTSMGKFGNAFAAARKAGLKTFMWNGKSYGTNTDPNWRQRWGLDKNRTVRPSEKRVNYAKG